MILNIYIDPYIEHIHLNFIVKILTELSSAQLAN